MDIILIPGLWLDGSSWEKVVPVLEQAGHRTHPLTLPGIESPDADRSGITLRDHVDAVSAAIDAVAPADGKVVLVGHSAGAALAHAAVDARPDRVARVVYVGGFPTGDGAAVADGYPAAGGAVPLPDWSAFADEDLADLDDKARAAFRARAIPSPAHVTRDPQRLTDERRYDVPVTVIATEFTSAMLRTWIAQGAHPVREFTKIRDRRGRAGSSGASPRGRRDRHPPGLPGVPARDPGVEVRGTGRGRSAGDCRRLGDDPGRDAQAPGLRRGRLVLLVAARARPPAPVGHGGLGRRPRLGLALGRRELT